MQISVIKNSFNCKMLEDGLTPSDFVNEITVEGNVIKDENGNVRGKVPIANDINHILALAKANGQEISEEKLRDLKEKNAA